MKRTLLAMGVGVLVSLMFVPFGPDTRIEHVEKKLRDLEYPSANWVYPPQYSQPFFLGHVYYRVQMDEFFLQTLFAAILAAVIVNIPWRRRSRNLPRKDSTP